jgi:hypothetical protein
MAFHHPVFASIYSSYDNQCWSKQVRRCEFGTVHVFHYLYWSCTFEIVFIWLSIWPFSLRSVISHWQLLTLRAHLTNSVWISYTVYLLYYLYLQRTKVFPSRIFMWDRHVACVFSRSNAIIFISQPQCTLHTNSHCLNHFENR